MTEATEFTFDIRAEAVALRKKQLAYARKTTTETIRCMKKRVGVVKALNEVGLIKSYSMNGAVRYGSRIEVRDDQLAMVRRVLMSCGFKKDDTQLKDVGNYTLISKKARTIYIHLECKALEDIGIHFYYKGHLDPNAKCQITTHSYDTISCSV